MCGGGGGLVHQLGQFVEGIPILGPTVQNIDKLAYKTAGFTGLGGEYGIPALWGDRQGLRGGTTYNAWKDISHGAGIAAATYGLSSGFGAAEGASAGADAAGGMSTGAEFGAGAGGAGASAAETTYGTQMAGADTLPSATEQYYGNTMQAAGQAPTAQPTVAEWAPNQPYTDTGTAFDAPVGQPPNAPGMPTEYTNPTVGSSDPYAVNQAGRMANAPPYGYGGQNYVDAQGNPVTQTGQPIGQGSSGYGKYGVPMALLAANMLAGSQSAKASKKQAEEARAASYPNADAVQALRATESANLSQRYGDMQRKLYGEMAGRGMRGGYVGGNLAQLRRAEMTDRATLANKLIQYQNTPAYAPAAGMTYQTPQQNMYGTLGNLAGGMGGYGMMRNIYPEWFS